MLQRGMLVSHETVCRWCAKFGQAYANGLHRRRPRPGDKRHPDEVFVRISGELKYLWRAVDAGGNVLDVLVQSRRDKAAARRFLRRPMKKTHAVPRVVPAKDLHQAVQTAARATKILADREQARQITEFERARVANAWYGSHNHKSRSPRSVEDAGWRCSHRAPTRGGPPSDGPPLLRRTTSRVCRQVSR